MGATSLDTAITLMASGRFRDALSSLQSAKLSHRDSSFEIHQALLADALQRTGSNQQAEQVATRLLRLPRARVSTLAKCHLVLGNVCREHTASSQGIVHFQKAIALADQARDAELECWARLRLIATVSDISGVDAATRLLPDVRRHLTKLGKPSLSAALHLWVIEAETKRGSVESALRHVQIAESILEQVDNVWLKGNLAINSFCVHFFSSNIEQAFRYAKSAVSYSADSGHAGAQRAAHANLGHLEFARGHLTEAENCFNSALRHCEQESGNRIAILDGLAQVSLCKGDLDESEALLADIQRIAERLSSRPSYYEAWSFQTKLQLLLRQRRWAEARDFALHLDLLVRTPLIPRLHLLLRLLQIEAFTATGDLERAVPLVYEILQTPIPTTVDTQAEIEHAVAKTLAHLGRLDIATQHFARAARILATVRNGNGWCDVITDYAAAIWFDGHSMTASPTEAHRVNPKPLSHVVYRTDAASSLLRKDADGNQTMDQTRAIFENAACPELFGDEVFDLLAELRCTQHLVLSATREGQKPEPLAWAGCGFDYAVDLAGAATSGVTLSLGAARDRNLSLLMVPRTDFASQINCLAVRKVVTAALDLESARHVLNRQAALWPADSRTIAVGETVLADDRMVEILNTLHKISPTNVTVLLTGETGTGKEVLARALHQSSSRCAKTFLPFNCTAVPRELVESQLFGYRRGAFSGAHDHFAGVIRAASGGTLFLDEIGELALEVQPKLLRFLECGEIHPLGEAHPIKVDVRVVAASNADLDRLVAEGRFREDLFYRLNGIRFRIPPLRERREEIPLLVQHFLKRYAEEFQRTHLRIAEETMECLLWYGWPGNVRQLANEIRRLVALAENHAIVMPEHLSPEITATRGTVPASSRSAAPAEVGIRLDQPLAEAIEHLERSMLRHALDASGGRVEPAARALGLSRKGLYLKKTRLGVPTDASAG